MAHHFVIVSNQNSRRFHRFSPLDRALWTWIPEYGLASTQILKTSTHWGIARFTRDLLFFNAKFLQIPRICAVLARTALSILEIAHKILAPESVPQQLSRNCNPSLLQARAYFH
jgi:hypothetical protein